VGSFTVENSISEHLDGKGQLMAHNRSPPDPERRAPGFWKTNETFNWAKTFSGFFEDELSSLKTIGEKVATSGATLFKGALDDLVKSLGTTVILPAGDVLMFKGMSADSYNNVFTTVTYNTPVGGLVETQAAKDVSHTGWQAPIRPKPKA